MAEEIYNLKFSGEETDEILESAKNVKEANLTTLNDISGFVCIDKNGNAIGMMSKEQVASVVGGLIGTVSSDKNGLVPKNKVYSLGYSRNITPGRVVKIQNIKGPSEIRVFISNGPSWNTDKPNIILLHTSYDEGDPNITAWGIMQGSSFSNIRLYNRGQDVYIANTYTYSTQISIDVISNDGNTIGISVLNESGLNLLEEEKLSIG